MDAVGAAPPQHHTTSPREISPLTQVPRQACGRHRFPKHQIQITTALCWSRDHSLCTNACVTSMSGPLLKQEGTSLPQLLFVCLSDCVLPCCAQYRETQNHVDQQAFLSLAKRPLSEVFSLAGAGCWPACWVGRWGGLKSVSNSKGVWMLVLVWGQDWGSPYESKKKKAKRLQMIRLPAILSGPGQGRVGPGWRQHTSRCSSCNPGERQGYVRRRYTVLW